MLFGQKKVKSCQWDGRHYISKTTDYWPTGRWRPGRHLKTTRQIYSWGWNVIYWPNFVTRRRKNILKLKWKNYLRYRKPWNGHMFDDTNHLFVIYASALTLVHNVISLRNTLPTTTPNQNSYMLHNLLCLHIYVWILTF
jgi:hypothetical protein